MDKHLTTLKEMRDELIKDAGHPVYAKQWEKDRIEALDAGIKAMELLGAASRVELEEPQGYGFERDWDKDSTFWIIDEPIRTRSLTRYKSVVDAYADTIKGESK